MAEYIDRDKTIAEIDDCFPANPTSEFSKGVAVGLAMAKVAVNHTPAADVRPVVRGKWIDHYEPYSTGEEWLEAQYGYECSICGRWEYEKEPFCNCGAKMEEQT